MKKATLYLTILILILCNTYNGSVFAQESSTTIIKQTGISRGLVVHLGLADIELEKSFAQQNGFLVRGCAVGKGLCEIAVCRSPC